MHGNWPKKPTLQDGTNIVVLFIYFDKWYIFADPVTRMLYMCFMLRVIAH